MNRHGRQLWLAVALGAAVACSGCGRQSAATEQAAAELADAMGELAAQECSENGLLCATEEDLRELQELYMRFAGSMDVHAATQDGVTMLHLACEFKKPELARCLLADGADANAVTSGGYTPLALAVGPGGRGNDEAAVLQLVETLVRAGARPDSADAADSLLLAAGNAEKAAEGHPRRAVVARLIELGCRPTAESAADAIANGWQDILERSLPALQGTDAEARALLLETAAECRRETALRTVLAALPPDADTATCALVRLTAGLAAEAASGESADGESTDMPALVRMAGLLVQHGADFYRELPLDEADFCAADFVCAHAGAREAFRAAGLVPREPELRFTEGEALHRQVVKAGLLHRNRLPDNGEAFDRVAAIITDHQEHAGHGCGCDTCTEHNLQSSALALLAGTDPARTLELVAALPAWRSLQDWNAHGGSCLLATLSNDERGTGLPLPPAPVRHMAQEMERAKMFEEAYTMTTLLADNPQARPVLEEMAQDSARPALQAGALAALLRMDSLPAPSEYGVETWLGQHPGTTPTPAMQQALLLTSLHRFWAGEMAAEEQQRLFTAMEEIGAPEAAHHYRELARCLADPTRLDELTAREQGWKYKFTAQLARFIRSTFGTAPE